MWRSSFRRITWYVGIYRLLFLHMNACLHNTMYNSFWACLSNSFYWSFSYLWFANTMFNNFCTCPCDELFVCCMLFHTDVMQLLPRSKQISPLGDTINWLDLIFEHQTITILSWYYTLTTTCCDQHGQCCLVPPVCGFLPGPPDGAVNWTLPFGDIGLEWRAQLNWTTLSQPCIRGGPKVLEVIQHSSVGQCLHLILRQEVDHLLDTPGVTLVGSC